MTITKETFSAWELYLWKNESTRQQHREMADGEANLSLLEEI